MKKFFVLITCILFVCEANAQRGGGGYNRSCGSTQRGGWNNYNRGYNRNCAPFYGGGFRMNVGFGGYYPPMYGGYYAPVVVQYRYGYSNYYVDPNVPYGGGYETDPVPHSQNEEGAFYDEIQRRRRADALRRPRNPYAR